MSKTALIGTVAALLVFGATEVSAQQSYHVNGPLRLNVRARSFLDAGNNVQAYSRVNPASALGQTVSYNTSPPWAAMRDRFGEGILPDPLTNGPFVGADNIFGPVDYNGALLGLPPLN